MRALARTSPTALNLLTPMIITNGLTVSTLYWAQSMVSGAALEFGPSMAVHLMPGATLAGYAAGVALLALIARDLTSPLGLGLHLLVLAASLCVAASATGPHVAMSACVLIGLGCSLTQRLLACAVGAVLPENRAETIAWIIAGGLCGILVARAFIPLASAWFGWRAMFWIAALGISLCGSLATWASSQSAPCQFTPAAPLPTALSIWRREAALRRAALQQAAVFAAFNFGWAVYPKLLVSLSLAPSLLMGTVATLGAVAALVSGRLCRSLDPATIASAGAATVAIAALSFILAGNTIGVVSIDMALLDIGTQVALVANQARAQDVALSPAMRGRIAAIVTTIGFGGGAIGASLGNLIR